MEAKSQSTTLHSMECRKDVRKESVNERLSKMYLNKKKDAP